MPTNTRQKALELLQNRSVKLTLRQISKDTGLPEGWLSMFHRGKIDNPSHKYLETLYEYLITRCHA
jgi:transcriptional regulator with XRE-family HTH domain